MKIPIIKPNGQTYMTVWLESGQLKMELEGTRLAGQRPIICLDEKIIPHLRSALAKLSEPDENNSVAIDRACFDRGCACFDPRIDKDAVIVEKRS